MNSTLHPSRKSTKNPLNRNLQVRRALLCHSQTGKGRAIRLVDTAEPFINEESDRIGAVPRGNGIGEVACALATRL